MKIVPVSPGHAEVTAEPNDLITLVVDGERLPVAQALPPSRELTFVLDRDATKLSYVVSDGVSECEVEFESGTWVCGRRGDRVSITDQKPPPRVSAVHHRPPVRKHRWSRWQLLVFGLALIAFGVGLVVIGLLLA